VGKIFYGWLNFFFVKEEQRDFQGFSAEAEKK
jgi:hypothetical protein